MTFFYDLNKKLADIETPAQKLNEGLLGTLGGAALGGMLGGPVGAAAGAVGGQELTKGGNPIIEKWDTKTEVSPEEKGKYHGKSKSELLKSYNALKKSGPHKKGSPEYGRMRELAFAIRAKSDWGKVKEEEMEEGLAGAALGGLAGGALTKTPSGAMTGAKIGSELQDKLRGKKLGEAGLPMDMGDDDEQPWHGIDDPELLQDLIADAKVMDYDEFYDEYSSLLNDPGEFWENYHEGLDEGLGDVAKKVGGALKKAGGKALDTLGHGSDEDLLKDLQKKMGIPPHAQHGKPNMAKPNRELEEVMRLAGLDEISRGEYIKQQDDKAEHAGKKSFSAFGQEFSTDEVDESKCSECGMDPCDCDHDHEETNESMCKECGMYESRCKCPEQVYEGKNAKPDFLDVDKDGNKKESFKKAVADKKAGKKEEELDEGWDEMLKTVKAQAGKHKVGDIERGHKHDIEHTATGRRVTRRHDDQGISVGADDDGDVEAPKRGRGRPKGTGVKMGAKGPSGTSKLMTREEIEEAIARLEECGYMVSPLEEKAVSKAQQRFMGMAHAMQKGEKIPGASKELKKVAKTMKKGDVEDFAKTKHKGLPEKKKKEVDETTVSGSVATAPEAPKAKGSKKFKFGQGVYEEMDAKLETLISESINVSVNVSTDPNGEPHKSVNVSADGDDAEKLAQLLNLAGIGRGQPEAVEVVDESEPDWPTDAETTGEDDPHLLRWAGGLNGPKSTGQTVGAPFNRQNARQGAGELVGNGVNENTDLGMKLYQEYQLYKVKK